MREILLNDCLPDIEGEFDIGLICSSSNQILVGNPLHKLSYGVSNVHHKKRMRFKSDANAVKLNCTNKFVAVASESLAIFDLERELSIRQLPDHNGDVTDVAWHHDSPYELASVSRVDGTLRTWDVRSHPAQTSVRRMQRSFSKVEYSPDSSFIVCSGESINIFDLNAAQSVVAINCGSYVTNIAFNPAECLLASASEDRIVRFWDVDTGECVTQSIPFESIVHDMVFHPHGKYLICASVHQLSAILWEPFNVVAQLLKTVGDQERKLWRTLHLSVNENRLLQLMTPMTSASKCYGSLSSASLLATDNLTIETEEETVPTNVVHLTSISLSELEQCVPKLMHAVMGCGLSASNSSNIQIGEGITSLQQVPVYKPPAPSNDRLSNQSVSSPPPSFLKRYSEIAISSLTKQHRPPLSPSNSCGPFNTSTLQLNSQTPTSLLLDVDNPFIPRHEIQRELLPPLPIGLSEIDVGRMDNASENGAREDCSSISEGRISVASLSSSTGKAVDNGPLTGSNHSLASQPIPTTAPMSSGVALRAAPTGHVTVGDVVKSKVAPARQRRTASPLCIAKRSETVHNPASPLKHSQTNIKTPSDHNSASPTKFSLKQLRSKSCSTNSKVLPHNRTVSGSSSSLTHKSPAKTLSSRMSTVSAKAGSYQDVSETAKLDDLLRGNQKVHALVKRRTNELELFLTNSNVSSTNSFSEAMVEFAAKQDDLRIFASLLKIYLDHPKTYSLGMNIKFMEKVRSLFAHQNTSYIVLALDLLEMTVRAFGDNIRHGLAAKCYALGVDVAAEQRFEKCNRCRNILLELQLNAPFLVERLNEEHRSTFNNMLSQIDRITAE